MRRTSKKILSLFLAVVMVVTTCSVGLTAFAKTNNPSIWSTDCEAEDAYAALDNLADRLPGLLMGIEAVANMVYDKYAKADGKTAADLTDEEKKEIAENATLQDILGAVQPVLLNVDLFGQKVSMTDFINWYETPAISGYSGAKSTEEDYYWFTDNGKNAPLDLPTIMTLCYNFRNHPALSSETRDELSAWYDELESVTKSYIEWKKAQQEEAARLENIASRINGNVPAQPGNPDYQNSYISATLYDLENFDFNLSSSDQDYVDERIALYQQQFDLKGYTGIKIDSLATLIYYTMGAGRNLDVQHYASVAQLVELGGGSVDYYGDDDLLSIGKSSTTPYDIQGINETNYDTAIINAVSTAEGMTERQILEAIAGSAALGGKTVAELNQEKADLNADITTQQAASQAARNAIITNINGAATKCWFNAGKKAEVKAAAQANTPPRADGAEYYDTTNSVWQGNYYSTNATYRRNGQAQVAAWATAENKIIDDNKRITEIDNMLAAYADAKAPVDAMSDAQIHSLLSAYTVNVFGQKILYGVTDAGVTSLQDGQYYDDALLGLAKKYAGKSASDVETAATSRMPSSSKSVNLTPDEISQVASALTGAASDLPSSYWTEGTATFGDVTYTCPASLVGTDVAKYFSMINANTTSDTTAHRMGLYAAFADNNVTVIQSYYDEAFKFATTNAVMEMLDCSDYLVYTPTRLAEKMDILRYYDQKIAEASPAPVENRFVPTDEQKAILEKYRDFTSQTGMEVTNAVFNAVIPPLLATDIGIGTIESIVNSLLETPVDLIVATTNLWQRLYTAPVKTVFELVPVLLTVINEVIEPLLFNNSDDILYPVLRGSLLDGKADFLKMKLGIESGSYIGVSQLRWDLNTLLPELMDWLLYKTTPSGGFYNLGTVTVKDFDLNENNFVTAVFTPETLQAGDLDHYVVTDQDGNEVTTSGEGDTKTYTYLGLTDTDLSVVLAQKPDAQFTETFTYEDDVPVLTGIYIADKALRDAEVSDLKSIISNALCKGIAEDPDLTEDEKAEKIATRTIIGTGLGEIIEELATLFDVSLYDYVNDPELRNQCKVKDPAGLSIESYGLNNLMVAIPQLFDLMENNSADKYGVDQDEWTYCYDGKIITNADNYTRNSRVEAFKAFAVSTDDDRSIAILDIFADIFVNDWLNAILSLLDVTISTDNQITTSLPIVSGLLNALGGLGEESVITDVLNGVFQIEREDDYSFTFEYNSDTGFTGLSKDNAYFLLTNIDRLIEVIGNLTGGGSDDSDDSGNDGNSADDSSTAGPVYIPKQAKNAEASSSNYTKAELQNTSDLIGNLDKMLSTLLSDSTFNGYSLDEADNVAASLVTLLTNYLGNDCFTDIMKYLNCYSFNLTDKEKDAPKGGDVDDKKVYSNESLTRFVVETYLLIEQIMELYLNQFESEYDVTDVQGKVKYNLVVEALEGIISPDAIALRLDDYPSAQSTIDSYNCWHDLAGTTPATYLTRYHNEVKIDWGITAGNKEQFFAALASSFRMITSILGVLLVDTNYYENILMPILDAVCTPNGVHVDTAEEFAKTTAGYHDEALLGILKPVAGLINKFLDAPVTTLITSVQGLAGILDDTQGATIASIVRNAVTPVTNEIDGLAHILSIKSSKLNAASPTLSGALTLLNMFKIKPYADASNIKIGASDETKYPLSGSNLVPIINSYLASTGITLQQIDWKKLNQAPSTAAAFVYIFEYLLDVLLDNDNLQAIAKLIGNDTVTAIINALKSGKVTPKDLLSMLNKILEATDSPTLAYWTFVQYLQSATDNFVYPKGVTKKMADEAVESLDNLVANIFPLLGTFGVDLGGDSLEEVLDAKAFTNANVTAIAKALYGALDGLDPTIKSVLNGLGIATSPAEVAKLLTDRSYGATYSSAASTIKSASSWSRVGDVNWGFTDGSSKAQQGFVNALAAVLRPINDVLAIFLNEGTLHIDDTLYGLICGINVSRTETKFNIGQGTARITYAMTDGVFVMNVREDPASRDRSRSSQLRIDFKALKAYDDLKLEGTNGYNSAIIPLLEAFQCEGVKSYSQYQSDVKSAKDNLILDILNPIAGDNSGSLLNKLVEAPFSTLMQVLPNIALYMDAHGLSQAINNLLAPVTGLIAQVNDVININDIVKAILGTDLGTYLGNLLGVGKINVDFSDLSKLNIEDYIVPIVNNLVFANSDNENLREMRLADIDWEKLIALGTITDYTSRATGSNGYYLTGRTVTDIDEGKVLITVLRYLGNFLIDNAQPLKNIISNIDAVAKNDLIKSIVAVIFDTIGASSADQIIAALFYILAGEPQDAFWDYRGYKTGNYSFAYPETVDQDFLKQLPPMLDGLISGFLDLNGLVNEKLFTDELVAKAAKGIYGAVEGVKVGDNSLTSILAQTDIDFSTSNVANLLVNKDYGQTFESAAATIRAAGSWSRVDTASLKFGVTDRDSFFHALVAVLRPIYGVLDVLLNDADLNLFNVVRLPGSNGYSSSIVPLMEAFSMYNIKTQYQYREDIHKEYDAILLDIINPIWDLVEDVLNAPLQTIMAIVPNLALFIGNDGLCQVINNLITPIRALLDSLQPIVDANELLDAVLDGLGVNLNSVLGKIGISNLKIDLYNIDKTLEPVLGGDAIVPLVNNILGIIKIGDTSIDLRLTPIDWLQLASHGETVVSSSQAATFGTRVFVIGDSSETLIAILRYLINTINSGDNFDALSSLVGGLIGGANDSISDVVTQVLGMLQGDTDEVISSLVDLLQTLA